MMFSGLHTKVLIVLMFFSISVAAQDSVKVLSIHGFFEVVKEHHPLSKQAQLQGTKGEETVKKSKGSLDPKVFTDLKQKYYNSSQYYSLINAGLKVPTWLGIDLEAGIEDNEGAYLNPENTVPTDGLYYAGVKIPLGQGLFMDKRRAEIKKANIYLESTEAVQRQLMNQLLYDAGKAYWNWFEKYYDMKVFEEAISLAQIRFNAVKQGAELGDKPFIDTLEAGIQLQNRRLGLQQAQLDFKNATALLNVFLWADGLVPLELDSTVVPVSLEETYNFISKSSLDFDYNGILNSHPELLAYGYKIEGLEIDQRWRKEQLKPVLNLKYNALSATNQLDNSFNYNINNYQWGLEFSMPIFLRKERGDVKLAKLKIQEAELDLKTKEQLLLNKARMSVNEFFTTIEQVELYRKTVQDYKGLLYGEREKFAGGESSLFMVNSRELGYINAKLKLINLVTKNRKAELMSRFAFGSLSD